MKNEAFVPASELSLPVPVGTLAGAPVLIGGLVGVTATKRGDGGNLPTHASVLMDDRAYFLPVDGAVAGVGTKVYIVAADNTLTTTAGSNVLFGHTVCKSDGSFATKGTGVATALVKLLKV